MISFFLGGDFRFFYPENIKDFAGFPTPWDSSLNTGLGQSQLSSLWITSYFNFTASFNNLGLSWVLIQLMFWVIPALLLAFFCSFYLFKRLFKFKDQYSILAGIIYSLNTYFLMILTGGQLGVSLSYSLVPLVLLKLMKTLNNPTFQNSILAGLALGFQIIFDPRIVYITLIAVFLYLLFYLSEFRVVRNKLLLLIPFIVAVLLNSFWILPLVLVKNSPLPEGFSNIKGFEFFSFADFSHSISLLHPNWPENIFGKIYFLDPKFLILPIIAFSSSLFVKNRIVLYFALVSILGIFLAKGINEPFGEINSWLFKNFPGMIMFRDPTKWYLLVCLGYSMLIPYSLREISKYFKLAPVLFVLYFFYLISPIAGQVKVHQVSQEYIQLKNFLYKQKDFSRTLWIPQWQRFGYFSNTHPAIGRFELLKNASSSGQILELSNPEWEEKLSLWGIKYVIVPSDSEGEIFQKDRKYYDKTYQKTVSSLSKISWLTKERQFGKIILFKTGTHRDRFYFLNSTKDVSYKLISPTRYVISKGERSPAAPLVFSEYFDKNWYILVGSKRVYSRPYKDTFNSFELPKDVEYPIIVSYKPQEYVEAGLLISFLTLGGISCYLILYEGKKWYVKRSRSGIQ